VVRNSSTHFASSI